jgi:hypothetical protein
MCLYGEQKNASTGHFSCSDADGNNAVRTMAAKEKRQGKDDVWFEPTILTLADLGGQY